MAADLDPTTEAIIRAAVHKFAAPRGDRIISSPWGTMRVHTPGERVLHLPNGRVVRVATDASGCATQIESDHNMHAVARPQPFRLSAKAG